MDSPNEDAARKYRRVLALIAEHRELIRDAAPDDDWQVAGPDAKLWAVLDEEDFHG